MVTLDADDRALVDSRGKAMERDIVQFVPFRSVGNSPSALAKEVLAEIPREIVNFFMKKNIMPNPAQAAPKYDFNRSYTTVNQGNYQPPPQNLQTSNGNQSARSPNVTGSFSQPATQIMRPQNVTGSFSIPTNQNPAPYVNSMGPFSAHSPQQYPGQPMYPGSFQPPTGNSQPFLNNGQSSTIQPVMTPSNQSYPHNQQLPQSYNGVPNQYSYSPPSAPPSE